MTNRETYFCATVKFSSDNIVRLHQKRTAPYLANKYRTTLSPKSKIYANDVSELLTNLNKVLRAQIIEFIAKKDVAKNEIAQAELARIIKELRRVRRELKQENLTITYTY